MTHRDAKAREHVAARGYLQDRQASYLFELDVAGARHALRDFGNGLPAFEQLIEIIT